MTMETHPAPVSRFAQYSAFWPFYLREHGKLLTRQIHYVGTTLMTAGALLFVLKGAWLWLLLVPVLGYGPAWIAHFFVEHNKPATFQYPWWSLISDYRMYGLWLTGKLTPELRKAGVAS